MKISNTVALLFLVLVGVAVADDDAAAPVADADARAQLLVSKQVPYSTACIIVSAWPSIVLLCNLACFLDV